MSTIHHLLLADLAEQLRVALPVIFGVLYVIAQLVSAVKQEKQKRLGQPERQADVPDPLAPRPKLAEAPPAAEKPRGLEDMLRKEVEEFLRRAQGKPDQPPGKRPTVVTKARPTTPQKPRQESAVEPTPRRLVESARSTQTPTPVQPASAAGGQTSRFGVPTGAAVDAYVTEQMRGVQSIAQRAEALGDEVAQADERMEAHLHSRFDHQLGSLAPVASTPSQASQATAATKEFRELLKRPGGMRQVIIASEILRRPEERWER